MIEEKKENQEITSAKAAEEDEVEVTLRPQKFAEFVGQEQVKKNLEITIAAAKKRKEPLEHILLYGPPGLGKTTLANVIAREMGSSIRCTSGPAIERAGDLASIITNLQAGDILFIDEIHRLNRLVEEVLYPAMEDFRLDIVVGKGPSARTLRLDVPRFTLIGATTKIGQLSSPLRDRFGVVHRLDFYEDSDIEKILRRSAKILEVKIDESGIGEIAKRARKTPRVANRLLRRVRDVGEIRGVGVTKEVAKEALLMLGVDELGLDKVDRKFLEVIIDKFNGGPVGLNTIAAAIAEEIETIEDVYEPFLMRIGFLDRTPRGRVATVAAIKHLKGEDCDAEVEPLKNEGSTSASFVKKRESGQAALGLGG